MAVVCLKGCLLNLPRNGVFGDLSNFDFSIFRFLLWCALVGCFFVAVFFSFPAGMWRGQSAIHPQTCFQVLTNWAINIYLQLRAGLNKGMIYFGYCIF